MSRLGVYQILRMAMEKAGATGGLGSSGAQVRKLTKGEKNRYPRIIFPKLRVTWATAASKSSCLRLENTYTAPAHIPKTMKVYCESLPVSTGWSQVSNISTMGQVSHASKTMQSASFRIFATTTAGEIPQVSRRFNCLTRVRLENHRRGDRRASPPSTTTAT